MPIYIENRKAYTERLLVTLRDFLHGRHYCAIGALICLHIETICYPVFQERRDTMSTCDLVIISFFFLFSAKERVL